MLRSILIEMQPEIECEVKHSGMQAVLRSAVLCCTLLFCAVLCCAVLCYTLLCCAVPCYAMCGRLKEWL